MALRIRVTLTLPMFLIPLKGCLPPEKRLGGDITHPIMNSKRGGGKVEQPPHEGHEINDRINRL